MGDGVWGLLIFVEVPTGVEVHRNQTGSRSPLCVSLLAERDIFTGPGRRTTLLRPAGPTTSSGTQERERDAGTGWRLKGPGATRTTTLYSDNRTPCSIHVCPRFRPLPYHPRPSASEFGPLPSQRPSAPVDPHCVLSAWDSPTTLPPTPVPEGGRCTKSRRLT